MPEPKRYTFVIAREPLNNPVTLTGFFDMLRYDSAQIIEADSTFVVLQTTDHEPTRARWQSFRLYILAEQTGNYPDLYHLRTQAHAKLPPSPSVRSY